MAMLHITNGDAAAAGLREAHVPGEVAVVADVLHEGPCVTSLDSDEWCERRARYLAEAGYAAYDEALERLVEADAALHAAAGHEEVVLWFEHDLFDQLLLLRVLAWFATRPGAPARLSLVCIGSHPAFSRFTGLGQLSPRRTKP
jgi:DNA-binding SARP family transcriptional activator